MDLSPDMDLEESRLCVRVAKLYYEGELTQQEIARKLGLSRIKVHRVLNRARELGVVEIKIHAPPNSKFVEQEHLLTVAYDLRDAVVVQTPSAIEKLYVSLAQGAARWLANRLEPGIRVGVGLGRTISHIPQFFSVDQQMDCTFMEVVGGSSENSGGFAKYNITSKLAEIAGGRAELLYAPNMVSSPELLRRLISEPGIAEALERARHCDLILQSVGTVDETAILYVEDRISLAELQDLQRSGAVGDALGQYFDENGNPVSTFLDERVIGLNLADLKRTPWSVVVAGGEEKHHVVRAALKGGFFNALVTDIETAKYLLSDYEG
ncbi:MAG: sugar-binding transcriptional regulator [Chloroflexota bacterium]|nr:sugar-binding transcriptional regulator [Chloroflexota bacterium]